MGEIEDMNYIREINAFYDWLETNKLSTGALSLWYALMHINNKTGWKNEFTVPISVLSVKTGLSPRAVTNARKELADVGRISWESKDGNHAAQYRINSLVEQLQALYADSSSHSDSDNDTDSISDTAADTTTTLNKHKHKQNNIYTPEFESFWQVYPRNKEKQKAFACWSTRIKQGELPENMIMAAKNYALSCDKEGREEKYIKLPATFLSDKKPYEDWVMENKQVEFDAAKDILGDDTIICN